MRRWMLLLVTGGLLCASACIDEVTEGKGTPRAWPTEEEVGSMADQGGGGDDRCEEPGLSDDGICDELCAEADRDCRAVPPTPPDVPPTPTDGCQRDADCEAGQICAEGACISDEAEVACGGWLGDTCDDDEYCDFGESESCDYADASGTCRPRPQHCPDYGAPVCGCDGMIYSNDCFAHAAGVDIYRGPQGSCELQQPCVDDTSCGAGDICEGGVCLAGANCDDGSEVLCDLYLECPAGQVVAVRDGCLVCLDARTCEEPAKWCGGSLSVPCSDDEYCDFGESETCDFADGAGICQPRPQDCPAVGLPVCGCDGFTYINACDAHRSGVDVYYEGICDDLGCSIGGDDCLEGEVCEEGICVAITPPYCGDGSVVSCDQELECPPGTALYEAYQCVVCLDPYTCEMPTRPCGGHAQVPCAADEYCHWWDDSAGACGRDDSQGICVPRPRACPDVQELVCGCDGQTYGNDCKAAAAGVDVQQQGACP